MRLRQKDILLNKIKKQESKELKRLTKKLEDESTIEECIICTIEEMSETTKVLTKYLRGSEKFSMDGLTEEIVHTLLMLNMLKSKFNMKSYNIDSEILTALRKWDQDLINKEK